MDVHITSTIIKLFRDESNLIYPDQTGLSTGGAKFFFLEKPILGTREILISPLPDSGIFSSSYYSVRSVHTPSVHDIRSCVRCSQAGYFSTGCVRCCKRSDPNHPQCCSRMCLAENVLCILKKASGNNNLRDFIYLKALFTISTTSISTASLRFDQKLSTT